MRITTYLKSKKRLENENLRLSSENTILSNENSCILETLREKHKEIKKLNAKIKQNEKELKRLRYILKVEKSFG